MEHKISWNISKFATRVMFLDVSLREDMGPEQESIDILKEKWYQRATIMDNHFFQKYINTDVPILC